MALMTVAELRTHVTSSLTDAALQTLLDAAETAITARVGAADAISERHPTTVYDAASGTYATVTPSPFLYPARRVATVTAITETVGGTVTTLAANDYRVWPGGWQIERLATGTNPRASWTGTVDITYAAASDVAERKRVQLGLVRLDLNHNPGLQSESIGDWSETYVSNSAMNYGLEREAILATLGAGMAIA